MYSGVGVSKGVARGELCYCKDASSTYEKKYIPDVEVEKEYVKQAFQRTSEELKKLYEFAKERVGLTVAAIISGHCIMLDDKGCISSILSLIETKNVNAEWAAQEVFQEYIMLMRKSEDSYQRARTADFEDLLNRVEQEIEKIKGSQEDDQKLKYPHKPFLTIGRQFDVEDILTLYEKGTAGILDLSGDEESHALVVAKSLDLPMIIQVNEDCLKLVGQYCTMDGAAGSVKAE